MPASAGRVALQTDAGGAGGLLAGTILLAFFVPFLLLFALVLAGRWKAYAKLGEPGWVGVIPIYNFYRRIELTDNQVWFLALWFIPFVQLYPIIVVNIDFADRFGQGTGFALGLTFLAPVFWPWLGFGSFTAS